jgi:predicted RND superfamily exporter protein
MHPTWQKIAAWILRGRIPLLIILGLLTAFMWWSRGTEISQGFAKVIPSDDPEYIRYLEFKKEFGEDGNVVVMALEGDLFDLAFFNGMYDLTDSIRTLDGVEQVVSLKDILTLKRDQENERFRPEKVIQRRPETQAEVDSIRRVVRDLPFYRGLVIDSAATTTLIGVTIRRDVLDSKEKIRLYDELIAHSSKFETTFQTDIRFAGLPLLRTILSKTLPKELTRFLLLAILVTAITLLVFFRSLYIVLIPLLVVAVIVIWSMGILGLLGFQITLITGIIPALITVIGIPNSVYLITKFHIEFLRTGNKIKSLSLVIQKIGIVTVMTNATTAVGLGVLAFTNIGILKEFGLVAGLSVVSAFFISITLIPVLFSYLPDPSPKQIKHLERKTLRRVLLFLDLAVHKHRPLIYACVVIIMLLSVWGTFRIRPVSRMADDIPQNTSVLSDLRFVEEKFNGVMPFEILIDTKKKRGIQKQSSIEKIYELQERMKAYPELSRSISIADFACFARQALMDGYPEDYALPSKNEFNFIKLYLKNSDPGTTGDFGKKLADSLQQKTRISANIRDIGSLKMKVLVESVKADIREVFEGEDADVQVTGTTIIYIKGNEYLIRNLIVSLIIAFVVVGFIIGLLFRSFRMVAISLFPNLLPLLIVAAIMGFAGIPLKPSTALIFSISFGIAVDDSIHFLARYRQARRLGERAAQAVSSTYKDTGVSMIYTSLILFFGFVIFTASNFGGTRALGLLTSVTLFIAMFSNLLFLPSLLLTFDKD